MSRQRNILIIDDDIHLSRLLQVQLEKSGHRVSLVANGREALDVLPAFHPHLIILDMNMPEMNGLQFFGRILTRHGRPRYPVLVMTQRAEFAETFRDVRAAGFLPKPFENQEFQKQVDDILGRGWPQKVYLAGECEPALFSELAQVLREEKFDPVSLPSGAEVPEAGEDRPLVIVLSGRPEAFFGAGRTVYVGAPSMPPEEKEELAAAGVVTPAAPGGVREILQAVLAAERRVEDD